MLELQTEKKTIEKKNKTKEIFLVTLSSAVCLGLLQLLIGIRAEHFLVVFAFNILYYYSDRSRKIVLAHLIFVFYLILFDIMKAFPNYWVSDVHIEDLYQLEKSWFGIVSNGIRFTPNEYLLQHTVAFWDVVTGIFYLCWLPVPLAFGFYLYFNKKKREFLHFYFAFLFVNLLGFVVYYAFPAAPPWYVQKFGFELLFHTPGNSAGLIRFDSFFGIHLFQSMYQKSSNVFAALPSLHSAYPVIVLFYGLKNKLGLVNVFFALVAVGIWFAAVYTSHHYVIDVLLGILCAAVGLFLFEKFVKKIPLFKTSVDKYEKAIS